MIGRDRWLGAGLLGLTFTWLFWRAVDLAAVSPVHWPLLLPGLVLEGVPAVFAVATGLALLWRRSSVRPLATLFAVTAVYAAALSFVAPEIHARYARTVRQADASWAPPVPPDRF